MKLNFSGTRKKTVGVLAFAVMCWWIGDIWVVLSNIERYSIIELLRTLVAPPVFIFWTLHAAEVVQQGSDKVA
ncbi:hypothetical protein Q9Q94_04305 [Uliginosibacterium sp. 31-16]|uniref:hypothetical protein n=1 Tax=Uliginosibacterium sp. 31-16 TaxID=3068315 RepID=UPI00273F7928|nr:hypothetical protein [Uliginosibacterium sp. 31-16]MDP5238736.1 hypothetical protein [Uliginosibacterium sp. 31-16]